jgi:hypothetical protein
MKQDVSAGLRHTAVASSGANGMERPMDFAGIVDRKSVNNGLVRLARHCEQLASGREMPHWRDFRPNAVSWMIRRLYLAEVIDGGADYFFKLNGSLMKEIYGTEIENQRLSALPDCGLKRTLRANYDTVVASHKPLYQRGELRWSEGQRIHVERLLVPFCDERDAPVMLLGAVACDAPLEIIALYRGSGAAEFVPLPLEEPAPTM